MTPSGQRSPGQLDAGLVEVPPAPSVPAFPIIAEWKSQQRLWGHSFHPMASYLAMFPAALAHAFIARFSRPGDVVLDPFSGRGTTALQACAEDRIGVGNDLNPLAYLLTAAKVDPPGRLELTARLSELRIRWSREADAWAALAAAAIRSPGTGGADVPAAGGRGPTAPLPPPVALCFHRRTLAQLLLVREALDIEQRADRFIAAAISGILHGKSTSYLSEVMPNSFSMAPRYVRQFVAETGFQPSERDVFICLDAKIRRLFRDGLPRTRGIALLGDARDAGARAAAELRLRALPERARLVVTSPPYLRVVKYGYYNWLRMWFLGIDPAEVDALLDDAHLLGAYLPFMRDVLAGLREWLAPDAIVVLVVGDVERDRGRRMTGGLGLAESVWRQAAEPEGYLLAGVALDGIVAQRKMTKIWGDEAGRATKTDRLLVIAPHEIGRRRALTGARTPIDWTWPPGAGSSVRIGRPMRSPATVRIGRPGGIDRPGGTCGPGGTFGPGRPRRAPILAADAADVSPRRSRGDGSAGPDEEPRPRPDDEPSAELHPAAAGSPLRS